MNRFWKFWKTYILVPSIPISALTIIISICFLDSDSWIPTILCAISCAWLIMIIWRNDGSEIEEVKRRRSKHGIEDTDDIDDEF